MIFDGDFQSCFESVFCRNIALNEHPNLSSSTETSSKQNTLNFFSFTYISYKFIIKKSSSRLTTKLIVVVLHLKVVGVDEAGGDQP